jgi:hypothetical protein
MNANAGHQSMIAKCARRNRPAYASLREFAQTHQCPEIRFRLYLDPADPPLLKTAARLRPRWGVAQSTQRSAAGRIETTQNRATHGSH